MVVYADKKLQVHNTGKENISWIATKYAEYPTQIANTIMITPGKFAQLDAENIEQSFNNMLTNDGIKLIPLQTFVRTSNGKDYVVKTTVVGERKNGTLTINTATESIIRGSVKNSLR